jgi:hypothetical protein
MAVAEMLKSMTIEVPIDVVAGELKDLFRTPKSIELMRDILPDFDAKHKIVEMDGSTHMVYEDGGLRATVDLTPVGDLTTVTIRVPYDFSNKGAAAVAVLAQLCAFESLEQGYKAGFKNGMSRP